jgi:hypothetical protein
MRQLEQTKESLKIARAALEAETHEVVQVSKHLNENLLEAVRRTWRQLLFIWAVVIVLAISYLLVLSNAPRATNLANKEQILPRNPGGLIETARPSQPFPLPSKALDNFPAIPEREDLLKVLDQIREAQFKKDIHLFLEAYSPTFPDLGQKRELTLNIWRRYDYIDLQFHVSDIQQKNASTIFGEITWEIKARDRKTDKIKTLSKSYHVHFSKESGKWLIQKLEAAEDKET